MIICFSGTGNSLYAAKAIGRITGDRVVSVNTLLKKGGKESFESERPYVFVCPTYAWRIPRIFERFIREARFAGSGQAYFVMTCGTRTGNALRYIQRLCADKDFVCMGLKSVVMPENYIALFEVPGSAEAEAIIRKAGPEILSAGECIAEGRPLPPEKVSLEDRFLSSAVNIAYYPLIVHARGFYSTDACTSCGACAAFCPLNNISLQSAKPVWGDSCTHCMACICRCPAAAIEYKKNSKGKPRYYCGGI